MKLEHRGTKILEKLISVPPRLLERLEYVNIFEIKPRLITAKGQECGLIHLLATQS